MNAICDKCTLNKEVHSRYFYYDENRQFNHEAKWLNFCAECMWRLQKKGYTDVESFLKDNNFKDL